VGEVALISDTISHYSPVLIAPLQFKFIAPARPEKKSGRRRARGWTAVFVIDAILNIVVMALAVLRPMRRQAAT